MNSITTDMIMMANNSASQSLTSITAIAVLATTTALVLSTLSTDNIVSRKYYVVTNSTKQLWRKRILSFQYYWNQSIVEQIRIYYNYMNTNNSHSNKNYSPITATSTPNAGTSTTSASTDTITELLTTNEEVEEFVYQILRTPSPTTATTSTSSSSSNRKLYQLRVAHVGRDSECMIIPPSSSSSSSSSSSPPSNSNCNRKVYDHYFIWFHYYNNNSNNNDDDDDAHTHDSRQVQCVQVPLLLFHTVYTKLYQSKQRIRTCTFCFIYDGTLQSTLCQQILLPTISYISKLVHSTSSSSSSKATTYNSSSKNSPNKLPLNYSTNPSWMVQLSILLLSAQKEHEEEIASSSSSLSYVQQLIQCFDTICTIESYSLCQSMTLLHHNNDNDNTMIYTIPTSIIPILLPVLHDLYPDDRHVFMYSGCIQSLQLVQHLQQQVNHKQQQLVNANTPCSFDDTNIRNNTIYTTPIYLNNSCTVPYSSSTYDMLYGSSTRISSMDEYYNGMAQLSSSYAAQVECWMTSIHTLLERQHIKKLNFLPYICKIDYILPSLVQSLFSDKELTNVIGTATTMNQNIRWSIRSLYQFITGSKSRELSSEILDAACSFVQEQESTLLKSLYTNRHTTITSMNIPTRRYNTISSSLSIQKVIENIVFQHKLVLLPNKTLLDTVQPTEHWTLKQPTKKGGCACCSPEDDEDEDDVINGKDLIGTKALRTERTNNNNIDEDVIGGTSNDAVVSSTKKSFSRSLGGFVDGSTSFAFDPSKFAI